MDKKMTPKNKLSKKDRARLDRERRVTWAFSPVSRVKKSKKCYRRADARQRIREDG